MTATRASELLGLLDLVPGGAEKLIRALETVPGGTVLPPLGPWLGVHLDSDSEAALARALALVGVHTTGTGVDAGRAVMLAETLRLVRDVKSELQGRIPPSPAAVVMTAGESEALRDLRRSLGVQPLVQHLENVIRDARHDLVLAAPYWNMVGLGRLRPAIEGALCREQARLTLIVQGGAAGLPASIGQLRRFVADLRGDGNDARLLAFNAVNDTGADVFLHAKFALADEHRGYLGSANMTEQGLIDNLEIGVRLGPADVSMLRSIISRFQEMFLLVAVD